MALWEFPALARGQSGRSGPCSQAGFENSPPPPSDRRTDSPTGVRVTRHLVLDPQLHDPTDPIAIDPRPDGELALSDTR